MMITHKMIRLHVRSFAIAVASIAAFAFSGVPFASAADISIEQGNTSTPSIIDIKGPITGGDADRFYALAQRANQAFVFLESPGGLVDDGLAIAAEVAQRGFTTVVAPNTECHSVCALIWVSGGNRIMDRSSIIGVHAAWHNQVMNDGTSLSMESGVANADIGSFLTHVGLSREAIRYFTTAGPDEVLPITPEIAQRLDIDTSVTDGDRFEMVEDRPTPRQLAYQTVTYLGLSGDCASFFGLNSEYLRDQGKERLKIGHDLFGGEAFVDLLPEFTERQKDSISSMGLKDWCTASAKDLRNDNLPIGISGPGFDCGKAMTSTEKAICGSFDLWLEDRALGAIYSILRNVSSQDERAVLAQKQRSWIKQRDTCKDEVQCILDRYQAWFLDLSLLAKNGG